MLHPCRFPASFLAVRTSRGRADDPVPAGGRLPPRRHHRARSVASGRGQHAVPAAGRFRRRGDQDRGPGQGRPAAPLARRGALAVLEGLCAQQEEPDARPAQAAGQGAAARPRRARARADRELPSGHAGEDGPRARDSACPQSAPCDRARLRLGADGTLRPEAGLRHAGGGHVGLRGQDRLSRPRSGAAADGARRHGGRALRSLCDDGGAARDRDQGRQGPGHRSVAARADPFRDRRRCGDVQGGRHHSQAPGQPLQHHQPAQRLPDARRPLDLDLGLHAVDGRAPLCHRRRSRHDQGPALCRQQRASGPSRRGRAAGAPSSSPGTTAPSASPSSRPRR